MREDDLLQVREPRPVDTAAVWSCFLAKVNSSELLHAIVALLQRIQETLTNRIRVLAGDQVLVEMTPYDLTKGRISYRFK